MLIYRLEREGKGPFSTDDDKVARLMFCAEGMAENGWPRKPFAPKDCFYACSSITYLKRWFSGFTLRAFIEDLGFTVNVYSIDIRYVDADTEQVTAQLAQATLQEAINNYTRIEELYAQEDIPTTNWFDAFKEFLTD